MKNECSIVCDLLPLYVENMVKEETSLFVRDHLDVCTDCAAKYEKIISGIKIDAEYTQTGRESFHAFVKIKNQIKKRTFAAVAIAIACVSMLFILLHYFPVYRAAMVGGTSFYDMNELSMLVSIGSKTDRAAAQSVLRQADAAFNDCRHTGEENKDLYGILARYATASNREASFTNHSLELLSAHLDGTEGYIWVFYSCMAFDDKGEVICGSSNVPSLWKVHKDTEGQWIVSDIREHP